MPCEAINFRPRPDLFDAHRRPDAIAETNGYPFKRVRPEGFLTRHDQADTVETGGELTAPGDVRI